jgi:C-terminal processing protease CtpA/Prc
MDGKRTACLCAGLLGAALAITADAQRVGGGSRGDRARPIESIPAVESYAPMTASVFEVLSVRPSDRVMRIRGKDGKTADVHVQEHVYEVSKLKAGDKVKVDFFQPDEGDTRLRAAGVWPAP